MNAPAKVDVLAVIARDAVQAVQWRTSVGQNEFALATESDDARAAVAELIAAVREQQAAEDAHYAAERMKTAGRLDAANARLRAALARVGGAT